MRLEPLIFIVSPTDSPLEKILRSRYAEGYRFVAARPEDDLATTLAVYRNEQTSLALFVYEQAGTAAAGNTFLQECSRLYPQAGRLVIGEEDAGATAVPRADHFLLKPYSPPEARLYPVIDELLAEWRASVDAPFMRVRGIMTARAVRIRQGDSLHRAAEIIALSNVGDLMVIDDDNRFIGVLSVGDVLRAAMPDIDEILEEGGTMEQAFRLFLRKGSELMYKPIAPLIIANPLTVDPDDHVAKAAALMLAKNIHRLPVVKDGRLVGVVGRADICQAVVGAL